MKMFEKLFKKVDDPFQKQANNLVSAARISAVGLYMPLLDRFPSLQSVTVKDWDFIVSIAGVFVAATRLNNLKISSDSEDSLMEIVAAKLQELDVDSIRAFEDCKYFFEKEYDRLTGVGHEAAYVASDAIGLWIVWNLFKRQPKSKEEIELVRIIGAVVTHNFFNWWSNN